MISARSYLDRRSAIRRVGSAIRSANTVPVQLPTRPELRRSLRARQLWAMLLPVALLVVATAIQILGRFVSAEDIGDEFATLAKQSSDVIYDWHPWVYFIPILLLLGFATLIVVTQLYEFIWSISATGLWIWVLPFALIVIALGLTLITLIEGVEYDPETRATMAYIFVAILIPALVVNWLVVSNHPNREQPGIVRKCLSGLAFSIICAAAVGAGFGALIGMDARDAAQERASGNGEVTVNTKLPPDTLDIDENSQSRAAGGADEGDDANEVDGNPWFTVASFFFFVFALLSTGIWWLTKFFGWRELVSQSTHAVRDVARDAVRASMHPRKSAVDAIATDIAVKVGKRLPQSRATESAVYIRDITRVATGSSPAPTNALVDPWLASALREGIASVCEGSGDNRPDYYYIYARAVQGVAEPLYDEFSDVHHLGLESLPADVLIAAKNLATDVADLIYRANIDSVLRKHRSGSWHSIVVVPLRRSVMLAFSWLAGSCIGAMILLLAPLWSLVRPKFEWTVGFFTQTMPRMFRCRAAQADDLASQRQEAPTHGTG